LLTCKNSLGGFAGQLADAIRGDLLGNLLPGVVLVPAMVIAIERAQAAGFAYN
jgi:intracellular sulfur oxidation DsrE/DsrF family protein